MVNLYFTTPFSFYLFEARNYLTSISFFLERILLATFHSRPHAPNSPLVISCGYNDIITSMMISISTCIGQEPSKNIVEEKRRQGHDASRKLLNRTSCWQASPPRHLTKTRKLCLRTIPHLIIEHRLRLERSQDTRWVVLFPLRSICLMKRTT